MTWAQAMSDLDKRSVASLAPFIERNLPPSCSNSPCLERLLPAHSRITAEDVTSVIQARRGL